MNKMNILTAWAQDTRVMHWSHSTRSNRWDQSMYTACSVTLIRDVNMVVG